MIGISVYPEKASTAEIEEYLSLGQRYGFHRLFLSLLQIDKNNIQGELKRYKKIIRIANDKNYQVTVDFVPQLFEVFGASYHNLKPIADFGIQCMRFDSGMAGKEESEMTHNSYGITIELNMSNYNHYLEQILDFGPNLKQLRGCHNFFPQKYTGLSRNQFEIYTKKYRQHFLKTAAFITSHTGQYGPWQLQEGLVTLEDHRSLPIDIQARDLAQSGLIDDVIIGTMFASKAELKSVSEAVKESQKSIDVEFESSVTDFEKEILFDHIHNYRGDSSEYMIRSTRIRAKITNQSLPSSNERPNEIKRGDILILNDKYGQYKGEVQIALKSRPCDDRINVVGKITENSMILLDNLKRFEDFRFLWRKANNE
ncbi:DUF871 domain-containing protein [Lapidilactobacillus mulanensis]|uniref:DUF871 domain-containing protein n=1 Tax=Lapidilactobacillus mulanensis TaxID=2485999 RepID=A0ABW4DII5_9LACO|nr:MupG family TIM beta-alpha barrel fold protein [Lapidilactobacillus mulanensis]